MYLQHVSMRLPVSALEGERPMIRHRIPIALMLVLLLAGCSAMDDTTVDQHTMQRLVGTWQQVDGSASLVFYGDESVKLDMPDEHPPLRLLSSVEKLKDHRIGFSIGDRWTEPAYVMLVSGGDKLQLELPSTAPNKGDGRTINFSRLQ
jgi:hypothetical protein